MAERPPSEKKVQLSAKVSRAEAYGFRSYVMSRGFTIDHVVKVALNDWLKKQGEKAIFDDSKALRGAAAHRRK